MFFNSLAGLMSESESEALPLGDTPIYLYRVNVNPVLFYCLFSSSNISLLTVPGFALPLDSFIT